MTETAHHLIPGTHNDGRIAPDVLAALRAVLPPPEKTDDPWYDGDPQLPAACRGLHDNSAHSPASALMLWIVSGDAMSVSTAIMKNNAMSDFANSDGISPLMLAAARNEGTIAALLARRALTDINRQCKQGWTALHYACYFGCADVLPALLRHAPDFSLKNNAGETAFDVATPEMQDMLLKNRAFRTWQHRFDRTRGQRPAIATTTDVFNAAAPQVQAPSAAYDLSYFAPHFESGAARAWLALCDTLHRIAPAQLADAVHALLRHEKAAKIEWDSVLIEAAGCNNAYAVGYVARHAIKGGVPQKALDRAFLRAMWIYPYEKSAETVHLLLMLGADPDTRAREMRFRDGYSFRGNKHDVTSLQHALDRDNITALQEIAIWSYKDPFGNKHINKMQDRGGDMAHVADIVHARRKVQAMSRSSQISTIVQESRGHHKKNYATAIAAYAHLRRRGLSDPDICPDLLVQAVMYGSTGTIKQLLADGFHPDKCSTAALSYFQHTSSPEKKSVMAAVLRGDMDHSIYWPGARRIAVYTHMLKGGGSMSGGPG